MGRTVSKAVATRDVGLIQKRNSVGARSHHIHPSKYEPLAELVAQLPEQERAAFGVRNLVEHVPHVRDERGNRPRVRVAEFDQLLDGQKIVSHSPCSRRDATAQ